MQSERSSAPPETPGSRAGFAVVALSPALGAEIRGVDLAAPMPEATFREIHRAFLEHSLLVFRRQSLTRRQIGVFAERFGELERHEVREPDGSHHPGVHSITNLDDDGHPSRNPRVALNYLWHSDKAHFPAPSLLTLLYATELPPVGGDTQFANMARAYEALPDAKKAQIADLRVVHDFAYARAAVGQGITDAERASRPAVVHPLVRTHPETGAKSLFLGMSAREIVGMPWDEGRWLIAELMSFATQPRFAFLQQWQLGDLVFWDNRCLVHRAVMNFETTRYRRVLQRCVVRGSVPV